MCLYERFVLSVLPPVAAEDVLAGVFAGFFLGELAAPVYSFLDAGTFAAVVVFGIAGGLFVFGVTPVFPAFVTDMLAEVALLEDNGGVGSPRTSEVDFVYVVLGGEGAVVEDIAEGALGGRGGGCDVRVLLAVYLAVLKPADGRAEDEVGRAVDVAVLKVDVALFVTGEECVLVAFEAAVAYDDLVAFGVQGDGLSHTSGVVFDGEIFECYAMAGHQHRVGAEGSHFGDAVSEVDNLFAGVVAKGDDGAVGTFSGEGDVAFPSGNDDFLVIGAVLDKDGDGYGGVVAYGVYGFLYGGVVAAAVLGHDEELLGGLGCRHEGAGKEKEEEKFHSVFHDANFYNLGSKIRFFFFVRCLFDAKQGDFLAFMEKNR